MPNPLNFHDIRRFGINKANKEHLELSRMRLRGYIKAGIFRGHYQPRETIDSAANFLGLEQREDVLEIS
ncbi:hypothetical protein EJ08DRAFT_219816 [Tothia fuscella]|uniref:Uncharacterized protein n=1 Tax=Tothia fuscella TaxID=1048955 RepID=A0A9P4TYW5_9PEZI|nr:hypothetical protein EJ08DRAFT_219816 [Tothia fuscella]